MAACASSVRNVYSRVVERALEDHALGADPIARVDRDEVVDRSRRSDCSRFMW